jgi:hypothetical protein
MDIFNRLSAHVPTAAKKKKMMIYEDPFNNFDIVLYKNRVKNISEMLRLEILLKSKNVYFHPLVDPYTSHQCMNRKQENELYKELKEALSTRGHLSPPLWVAANIAKMYFAFNSFENREILIKLADRFLNYDYMLFQQSDMIKTMVWGMRMLRELARNEVDFQLDNRPPNSLPRSIESITMISPKATLLATLSNETKDEYAIETAKRMQEQSQSAFDEMLKMGRLFADEDIQEAEAAYAAEIEVEEVD